MGKYYKKCIPGSDTPAGFMNEGNIPKFWDIRYAARHTPWDFGGVPKALEEYLVSQSVGSVLIPGCGFAYEVQAFAQAGWQVDALDFSAEAVRCSREILGEDEGHLVRCGNFFEANQRAPFDLIYERTFLCALPPELWPDYAGQVSSCLRSGGKLAGFFFFGPEPDGPPFPLGPEGVGQWLGEGFRCLEDSAVTDSLTYFQGKERWQVWKKL